MSSFILVQVANVYAKYLLQITQTIPNTRYLPITKIVCHISGVIACNLLLSILLPPFWWWIIISPCAFKSIRELHGSYQQISELIHHICHQILELLHSIYIPAVLESLHGISARVFNKLHYAFQQICNNPTQQASPQAIFNDNSVLEQECY